MLRKKGSPAVGCKFRLAFIYYERIYVNGAHKYVFLAGNKCVT